MQNVPTLLDLIFVNVNKATLGMEKYAQVRLLPLTWKDREWENLREKREREERESTLHRLPFGAPSFPDLEITHCMTFLSCVDINECSSNQHTCHRDAKCINTVPGYQCHCNLGYTSLEDGRICEGKSIFSNQQTARVRPVVYNCTLPVTPTVVILFKQMLTSVKEKRIALNKQYVKILRDHFSAFAKLDTVATENIATVRLSHIHPNGLHFWLPKTSLTILLMIS